MEVKVPKPTQKWVTMRKTESSYRHNCVTFSHFPKRLRGRFSPLPHKETGHDAKQHDKHGHQATTTCSPCQGLCAKQHGKYGHQATADEVE